MTWSPRHMPSPAQVVTPSNLLRLQYKIVCKANNMKNSIFATFCEKSK